MQIFEKICILRLARWRAGELPCSTWPNNWTRVRSTRAQLGHTRLQM
jgi:hypothetical protein